MTPLEHDALAKALRLLGHAQAFVRDACGPGFTPSFPAARNLAAWREWVQAHPQARAEVRRIVARTFDRRADQPSLQENRNRPQQLTYAQRLARGPTSIGNSSEEAPG